VFTARYLDDSKTKPTLLSVGAPFPDQPLTLVINQEDRKNFVQPEEDYLNKTVMVTGRVVTYKGKPQIVLHDRQQILSVSDTEPQTAVLNSGNGEETTSVKHTTQNLALQTATGNGGDGLVTDAEFPGGSTAFGLYLRDNLLYPELLKKGEEKTVVTRFEIDAAGLCQNIAILQSPGTVYDNEVKRVLAKMPAWKPASKNGTPVSMLVTQPITFKGSTDDTQKKASLR
jgi:TonB family protein